MEGDIDIRRGNKTAFRDHCHSEPSGAPMTALRTAGCRSEGGREGVGVEFGEPEEFDSFTKGPQGSSSNSEN